MTGRWFVIVLAIADLVAFAVGSALDPYMDPWATVIYAMVITSFVGVGAILCIRVPRNPIGILLLTAGTIQALGAVTGTYSNLGLEQTPEWPGSAVAGIVVDLTFIYPVVIVLIGVPLVFPDGHFPSPRYRWVAWLAVVAMIGSTLVDLFSVGTIGSAEVDNPLAIPGLQPILELISAFVSTSSIIGFGGAAAAVWTRYRHGSPVVREQTKWLLAVAAVAAIAFPVAFIAGEYDPELANVFFIIGVLSMAALPLAIGVAVLRYRLFEIDRIISRTVGWTIVTTALVLVFGGAVIALQAVLAGFTQGQTVAVATSTLAVFALFQPLRRRIQRAVDRRFDRARYDGERTVMAFSERLRNETDMGTVTSDLVRTADQTVAPSSLGIWLRGDPT